MPGKHSLHYTRSLDAVYTGCIVHWYASNVYSTFIMFTFLYSCIYERTILARKDQDTLIEQSAIPIEHYISLITV